MVNFWATWCAPCRREMPALDRLQRAYGGRGFVVLALSLDRTGRRAVEPFYREIGLNSLDMYFDPGGRAQRAFGISLFPTSVLIDARGRVVGRLEGPAEWMAPEARALIRHYLRKRR